MKILETAKTFVSNRVAIVVTSMLALSLWNYSRIAQINPAILQDEWIYQVTSRLDIPWSQSPSYDFGNYLFNLVYSSTNLCGEAFFSCAKILNLFFLATFALALFAIAIRFMAFWWAFALLVAIYLSPVSIYASMYLPESIYFAMLGLSLIPLVLRIKGGPSTLWIWTGGVLGLAALSKPHALFSVAAIGLFLIVFELNQKGKFKDLAKSVVYYSGSFLLVRLGLGLAIAGPKALNLLGTYGAGNAVGEFVTSAGSAGGSGGETLVGAGPVAGAVGLFIPQISTHSLVMASLTGALLAVLILAAIESIRRRSSSPETSLAVLMLIWVGVMITVVALFTGWITGGGDDHTNRVLLRYYEFLVPVVSVAAFAYLFKGSEYRKAKAWSRILAGAIMFLLTTMSFGGLFSGLQIQIADAPSVAGLISQNDIWNLVGVGTAIGVVAIAFFPKPAPYVVISTFVLSMVGMGWQTQNQYLDARGNSSEADVAGQFVRNYVADEEVGGVVTLSNSRFDGRVASFWMEANNELQILPRGTAISVNDLPADTKWVLSLGLTSLDDFTGRRIQGDGFALYQILKPADVEMVGEQSGLNLDSLENFSEPMGGLRWTLGNEAKVTLKNPYPTNATVRMTLSAMPELQGQDVEIQLGDSSLTLKIQEIFSVTEIELQFLNTQPSSTIEIRIPGAFGTKVMGLGIKDLRLVR